MKSLYKSLRAKKDAGFTLIELLVVVLILGILSVIAVVAVNNARTTAVNKACAASAASMLAALDQYKALSSTTAYPTAAGATYTKAELTTGLVSGYLQKVPAYVGDAAGQDYYLKVAITGTAPSQAVTITGYSDSAGASAITGCTAP